MTSAFTREQVRQRFDTALRKGELLVGAAVGTGSAARGAIQGGADFVVALSAGRLRMMGAPSISSCFPVYQSRQLVEEFAVREFLSISETPIFVGVSVMDPVQQDATTLKRIADLGFAGVVNWPATCTLPDGYKHAMNVAGCGFDAEIKMLARAKEFGLFSCAYVDTSRQVVDASAAEIDMINYCFGWSAGGQLGHTNVTSAQEVCGLLKVATRKLGDRRNKTYFVAEGGPIIQSKDLKDLFEHAAIDGYVGGSTLDRIPLEEGIKNSVIGFKDAHKKYRASGRKLGKTAKFASHVGFVGISPEIMKSAAELERLIGIGNRTFALHGELGSETERIAESLARINSRQGKTVWVRCNELTRDQWITRVFGRNNSDQVGLLGTSSIATLILVMCEALNPALQRRLARAILSDRFRPVGGGVKRLADFSIVLVQQDIKTLIDELRYAVSGSVVEIPPLRDRPDDLSPLLEDMLSDVAETRRPVLSPSAELVLRQHAWPGNVSELEAFATKLMRQEPGRVLEEDAVRALLHTEMQPQVKDRPERELILAALRRNGFRKGKTAKQMGISRKTLYNKLKRYAIEA